MYTIGREKDGQREEKFEKKNKKNPGKEIEGEP